MTSSGLGKGSLLRRGYLSVSEPARRTAHGRLATKELLSRSYYSRVAVCITILYIEPALPRYFASLISSSLYSANVIYH